MSKDLPVGTKPYLARKIVVKQKNCRLPPDYTVSASATPKCPPPGSRSAPECADRNAAGESIVHEEPAAASPPSKPPEAPPFIPLDDVPPEPARWQAIGLLKKSGVTVLVVPPGAACFALCAFFAGYLSGRTFGPFGPARYPGDVLFTTHTPGLDRSLRAAIFSFPVGEHKVLTQRMPQRFDWKKPRFALNDVLKERVHRRTAAVIIDAGPVPQRLEETYVEAANAALNEVSEAADCLVLVVVESSSTNINPFERIPRCLRFLRGPLLAVPLRSKTLAPQPHDPAEFLLMRLVEASPSALAAPFKLTPTDDLVETSRIWWGAVSYGDPLEVFRMAETLDLSHAQRVAVQFAAEIILTRGPTSRKDLQAAGKLARGISPTTMRDALSMANLLGHMACARSMFDGTRYWIIPGVTQLPPGMYIPGVARDDQIPF